jgi:predicted transcriptional regulator
MKLTDKQLEIMSILWKRKVPMTTCEIVAASDNRTWKERSIFSIINILIDKGAVALASCKGEKNAREFKTAVTFEEYTLLSLQEKTQPDKLGIQVDYDVLIEGILKIKES